MLRTRFLHKGLEVWFWYEDAEEECPATAVVPVSKIHAISKETPITDEGLYKAGQRFLTGADIAVSGYQWLVLATNKDRTSDWDAHLNLVAL